MKNALLVVLLCLASYLPISLLAYNIRNPELTQMQVFMDIGKAIAWK